MARITVEDCIDKFPSRFELVLVASNRARKLHSGENPTIELENDKNTVIALREIAQETVTKEQLRNNLIEEYQVTTFSEDDDINELEDNSDESQFEETEVVIDDVKQDQENDIQTLDKPSIETSYENLENSIDEEKTQNS